MLTFKKDDYEFFFPLLGKDEQKALTSIAANQGDSVLIDDEDTEINLYDWLNDLVVLKGLDKDYEVNSAGKRLEKLSDYIFSVIEA